MRDEPDTFPNIDGAKASVLETFADSLAAVEREQWFRLQPNNLKDIKLT